MAATTASNSGRNWPRPAGYDDGRMRANDGSEEVRSLSPEQLMEAVAEAREEGPAP